MKKLIIPLFLILTLLCGCAKEEQHEIGYSEAIKKFNWVSYDEKPFLYKNIFAHECKVFVCDIDNDEIPEIMLTEIYSPREANATEILKFENDKYTSAYGFWGKCYSEENNISVYKNQNNDEIVISKTSSYHGGVKNTVVSEINISSFSYKVLYGKTEYDNGNEKYFIINEEKEITRDFIDGGFSGCDESEKSDFEAFIKEYENSLDLIREIPVYDCGFLSLENLPTSNMLSDESFDYEKYMENKDSPENRKKSNDKISEEIIVKSTSL